MNDRHLYAEWFPDETSTVFLPDLISALSFALDLVADAAPGHAVRTCLLGMRMAAELGLSQEEQAQLYYALLLKDLGSSKNAGYIHRALGGDDRSLKHEFRLHTWRRVSFTTAQILWHHTLPDSGAMWRMPRFLSILLQQRSMVEEFIRLRCEQSAKLAQKMGLSPETTRAIQASDEHWNGKGYPAGLQGQEIPILARIVAIAQHLDLYHSEWGDAAAVRSLRNLSGSRFDPELVQIAKSLHRDNKLWEQIGSGFEREMAMGMLPANLSFVSDTNLDGICEAFAAVVDAKSSFTYHHSIGVTRASLAISDQLGLVPEQRKMIYRAALLHDLGKLSIPNTLLDSPKGLTTEEWKVLKEHPRLTRKILEKIEHFQDLARVASQHHEKLDGSGYPDGLTDRDLSIEARVIAVADVYGALSEDRPDRPRLSRKTVLAIMKPEVPRKLDSHCFDALLQSLDYLELETDKARLLRHEY